MRFKILILLLFFQVLNIYAKYTPSPENWSEKMIYFLLIDRFANGDKTNDDLGYGEYDPAIVDNYHGGDLQGLISKLDYIVDLGAGAIWVNPPVHNQWVSPLIGNARYYGYHGYWAYDLYNIDPHIGDLKLYREFVDKAHEKGLYVIQDIVCNHIGDYYDESGNILPEEKQGFKSTPAFPFDEFEKRYDYFNIKGDDIFTKSFAGLDDFKTTSREVQDKLIEIFKFWIREADIDGYRIDTVKYVENEFWHRFCNEIREYAASLGKDNFIIFGEDYEWDYVKGLELEKADIKQAEFTGKDGDEVFNSMLNFSFCGAVTSCITGSPISGKVVNDTPYFSSFKEISDRFSEEIMSYYTEESRYQLVNFIDNHDMTRFLFSGKANRDESLLKLALGILLTSPGVPCLYYGTEQGFYQPKGRKSNYFGTNNRQDLWESGYDKQHEMYKFISKINAIRSDNPVLSGKGYRPLIIDGDSKDLFVYERFDDESSIYVVINRGKKAVTVNFNEFTDARVLVNLIDDSKKYTVFPVRVKARQLMILK